MDDDGGDWFGGGDDEPPPAIKPLKKSIQEEDAPQLSAGDAPAEDGEAPQQGDLPPEDEEYLDPDKLLLFKHWIRPKFLPYKYISLYRKIYYDDVIDYLDKRCRGIPRDLPHAETWAERPKFLPYKYIYEYRKNYYDDIMEVLASRRKGIRRNIPQAQTWAERICRTRSNPVYKVETFNRYLDDVRMVARSEISGAFYKYYSKEQFNRRFSKLLF